MATHNEIGQFGEELASQFLLSEGYEIVLRNWRPENSRAEVDIVLRKGRLVIFVEVKTRTSEFFGEPEEYVQTGKQRHLAEAANAFLRQNDMSDFFSIRFDVVAILLAKGSLKWKSYRHITNAFQPSPKFY